MRFDDYETREHNSIIKMLDAIKQKLEEQSKQIKVMQEDLMDRMKFDLVKNSQYKDMAN
jgi:hypothetical protein